MYLPRSNGSRAGACLCFWLGLLLHFSATAQESAAEANLLVLPKIGEARLQILSPTCLELLYITTKQPDPAPVESWNLVDTNGQSHLPPVQNFVVTAGTRSIPVKTAGFKRRPLYAPLKQRDLRIGNYLYLELGAPVAEGENVEVKNSDAVLWPASVRFVARLGDRRLSPVIHVNQVGYQPGSPKSAVVGYFLGSLGELDVDANAGYELVDARTFAKVHEGRLVPRPDQGFTFSCYQRVWEADFTGFSNPGEYRIRVAGLGVSLPFFVDDGAAAAFARTYALGLYHQRCGTSNALPWTRFVHAACHVPPADLPDMSNQMTLRVLGEETASFSKNPRHVAPQLKDVNASLYPFVNRGPVDVAGGHHDAGDYSKYTANSAGLIHYLMFSVDTLSGVAELDNLGLPESGDGIPDVLQEAKWEADFLAKLQDADGGFYFLVYPQNRRYENNVTPDKGDPQIVWPKNTAVTAAAVAALAQCASSPHLRRHYPQAATNYLAKALKGWAFLTNAMDRFGKDGAYQRITHYGDEFMHDDEMAWAACELYLATGNEAFHRAMREWLEPGNSNTRKWGWWRMYEGFGCAMRSYAFAVKAGKCSIGKLDLMYLRKCEAEIVSHADDILRSARESAYGTSFPAATKRVRSAGWYFSADNAFDLAVASELPHPIMKDPRPKYLAAVWSNLGYEAGCNPVNVCFPTGLGWVRDHEIVHQYAQNDRRVLPPSGIPMGNLQGGFGWLDHYKKELGLLTYPSDGAKDSPYPIYDRWSDSFNVQTEFVILNQGRALGACAWLMAKSPLKSQPWKSVPGRITGIPAKNGTQPMTLTLQSPGIPLENARIVWEADGLEPVCGQKFTFTPGPVGPHWIEAEAQLPDGRRIFAVADFGGDTGSSGANAAASAKSGP